MTITLGGSGVAVYPPGATFGPRRLPDFEFVWLLQGTAQWRYDQGSIDLRPGSLLLGRPGTVDSFVWDRTVPTRHAYLHFRLDEPLPDLPDPALWPLVRRLPGDDPLRPLLRYLLDLGEGRTRDQGRTVREVLRLLLLLFVAGLLPDRAGRPLPPHLDALLGFVRRAWAPPAPTRRLTLQELAAGACVSSGYLSRVFRHHYGVGPVAAFELLRLGRAATLLVRSNLAVAAVARDCGFANPYHFSRRFHRVYGQPPGRYRHAAARLEPSEPLARAGLLALGDRIWRAA
ncbi:MAG TPA: AraC family transcriptional regulator [Actinomycetes bacterium]|nr:AraC family transcriptional regulator [Actinomycetes bacterium]